MMHRPGDAIGQGAVGRGRLWRGLLAGSAVALLSGCGWFDSDTPVGNARPGADRQAPIMSTLPPPASGQHDAGIVATDPAATAQIGSIIPAKGGQKAQKEEIEKEAAERDAMEREEREKREAEERDAKAREEQEQERETAKPLAPAGGLPGMPAAAVRGNRETGDTKPGEATPGGTQPTASPGPPATTAPPPAPVTTAPIPPPTAPAPVPPPNPAPAAEPPATPPKT